MSMYHMMLGINPIAGPVLYTLGLESRDFGRFRDAWLTDKDGELKMVIHTRCGGGNRPDYEEMFGQMREHPLYSKDYDCDFDPTYANIEFHIPEDHLGAFEKAIAEAEENGLRDKLVINTTQGEGWKSKIG